MKYKSTRGGVSDLSFEDAVMMGLAEDGGLLIPQTLPKIFDRDLKHMSELPYVDLALEIMKRFDDDTPLNDLRSIIKASYSSFEEGEIIPVVKAGGLKIAELFHGPTFAFKDFALQFLGNLFEYILRKNGKNMNILGATSGDTGSAAIYGVRGKKNINIFILYPQNRISAIQEMQMTSASDPNVHCLSVRGSFDNCQEIVKDLFNDIEFKKQYELGAVNSINWARILAQIVYYFYIYFKVARHIGDPINVVVPTGNFGNIFAGYLAKTMGLPIGRLVLATNRNNILNRAIKFGDYSLERVHLTSSPSMDIQVPSNFERYLYYLNGGDEQKVVEAMDMMKREKELEFRGANLAQLQRDFITSDASDEDVEKTIHSVYRDSEYIIDPHTACGVFAANKLELLGSETVCLATAHPAKFPEVIKKVLGIKPIAPEALLALEGLPNKSVSVFCDTDSVRKVVTEALRG